MPRNACQRFRNDSPSSRKRERKSLEGWTSQSREYPLVGDNNNLGIRCHHSHAAVESELTDTLRREMDQGRARLRENFAEAEPRGEQRSAKPRGLTAVDDPLNGNALLHGQLGRLVFEVHDSHGDALPLAAWVEFRVHDLRRGGSRTTEVAACKDKA